MNIIWKIRLPRVLMAGILGGALALSGFYCRHFFQPDRRTVCTGDFFGCKDDGRSGDDHLLKYYTLVSSYILIIAAFIGSMLSIGFILLLARKIRNMATLLVGGIMIGYICSAVTDFVVTFAEDSDIVNLHWLVTGKLFRYELEQCKGSSAYGRITLILTFSCQSRSERISWEKCMRRVWGVNIRVFRVLLILLSSVFSACVTAFAGPISFVGIAVP